MSHLIMHAKPSMKLRQLIVISMIAALVLSIYTLLAISSWTARPSTLEADPLGPSHEGLSPAETQAVRRFSRDPDAPGRRF